MGWVDSRFQGLRMTDLTDLAARLRLGLMDLAARLRLATREGGVAGLGAGAGAGFMGLAARLRLATWDDGGAGVGAMGVRMRSEWHVWLAEFPRNDGAFPLPSRRAGAPT